MANNDSLRLVHKKVDKKMDIPKFKKFDRREIINSSLENILERGQALEEDEFPAGWVGEREGLVEVDHRYTNVYVEEGKVDDSEVEDAMEQIKDYAKSIRQSIQKMDGNGRHGFYQLYRKIGIASSFSNHKLGKSSSFYSALIQALEGLGNLRDTLLHFKNTSSALIVNDSTNGLTAGILMIVKKMEIPFHWTGVISSLFCEELTRNYQNINDVIEFAYPNRIQRCTLLERNINEEVKRVTNILHDDYGYSVIVSDVTGDHVLEDLRNVVNYEGTKWLFLTRQLIRARLWKKGNVILRLHVRPLASKTFITLLADITRDFQSQKWILPIAGRDTGVLFLVLYNYVGSESSSMNVLCDTWPIPNSIKLEGRDLDCVFVLDKMLEATVPAYTAFVDCVLQMMFLERAAIDKCAVELTRRRKKMWSTLGLLVLPFLDKSILRGLIGDSKPNAIIFNWFEQQSMPIDTLNGVTKYFSTNWKDEIGLLLNVQWAKRVGLANRRAVNDALRIFYDFRLDCSSAWERKNPKYLNLEISRPVFRIWNNYPNSSHPMKIIINSRWCLSGLVPIRGALKEILSPHANFICRKENYEKCGLCRTGDEFLSFCKSLGHKEPFMRVKCGRLIRVCLAVSLTDFVTQTDKDLCYARASKVIREIVEMKLGESFYLCNPCLLTNLDLGLIYLVASLFSMVTLVASMDPWPTYGVLFCCMSSTSKYIRSDVIEHVNRCIQEERSEFVDVNTLNGYFATHHLHAMNTCMLNNWLKVLYRDLKKAGLYQGRLI